MEQRVGQGCALRLYTMTTAEAAGLDRGMLRKKMPQRMEKAERFRFENGQLLSIAAGYMMFQGLGLQSEGALSFTKEGKPYAEGYPAFNVSHSGEMAVMVMEAGAAQGTSPVGSGAAQGPGTVKLGVDTEQVGERHMSVARRAFSGRESEWMLSAENETDRRRRFYRLWTLKEAVMKAAGLGLSMDPLSFEVMDLFYGRPAWIAGSMWHARSLDLEDYVVSVCSSAPIAGIEIGSFISGRG